MHCFLFPGFLDFASIAVVGRLTGTLVGGNLSNLLPGIRVFGGSQLEQSLWLIGMFVALIWLQSLMRITLRVAQERMASQIWLDLSQRIFSGIIRQPSITCLQIWQVFHLTFLEVLIVY